MSYTLQPLTEDFYGDMKTNRPPLRVVRQLAEEFIAALSQIEDVAKHPLSHTCYAAC